MAHRATCTIIRLHRTTADIPEFTPEATYAYPPPDICVYDPWFCVACGHPHHGMTRHHRLPKRVAWKIPPEVWLEVLDSGQRVVPMCKPCHTFIENPKGAKHPCKERINAAHAKLTWARLIEEIQTFDRIAYERTEELIRKVRAGEL